MKPTKVIFFLLSICLVGCTSLKDQAKSRQLLGKCKYSLEKIYIEKIDFDDLVKIVGLVKEVNFKNPGPEVVPLLNQVRKMNFDLNFKTLDINTSLGISNPNDHQVIIDSVAFDAFLDGIKVANVIHDGKAVTVAPNSKGEIDLIFALPTSYRLKKVVQAEMVNLKGKVWLKIELIKGLPVTIPFNFDVTKEVPREQIQKLIDAQKRKVVARIVKELVSGRAKDLLNKFKN